MRLTLAALVIAAPVALILSPVFGLTPDAERAVPPDFIVTAAPAYVPLAELRGQERFPKGAQLLLVHAGKAEPLLTGFASFGRRERIVRWPDSAICRQEVRWRSVADLGT
jgi:hypothetical protein